MRILRRRNRQRFIEIGVGHPGTFLVSQWISRSNIKRTGSKTVPLPSFECISMDGSMSTKTNGLQEYFVLWYSNADTGTKACTCSMGNPT